MNDLIGLKGVGSKTALKLNKLLIQTPIDLIYHFPKYYLDFTKISTVEKAYPEDNVTLKLTIIDIKNIYSKKGKNLQIAQAKDSTGQIKLIWINQPYIVKTLKPGQKISVAGTISFYQNQKTIFFPKVSSGKINKIYPIYPETKGLTSNQINKIITSNSSSIYQMIDDNFPTNIIKKHQLIPLETALKQIHQPQTSVDITQSQQRLGLDELVTINLQSISQKKHWLSIKTTHNYHCDEIFDKKINRLLKSLTFKLTKDQKQTWNEVKSDLLSGKITNRLIQGDVGSGKTIIALLSCYFSHLNHHLSIVIAPTQILANQHYQNFSHLLPKNTVHLLTSSTKLDLTKIKSNSIIIATHAVFFQQKLLQQQVGLVVIDEQHKFGVDQRNKLFSISNPPHSITMTATPIPRSVKLTLLKNLDISSIKTMPKNRQLVKSFLVFPEKQAKCYHWLHDEIISKKTQAFVICPFIEDSDNFDIPSVQTVYKDLVQLFPDLKIGLIHGQLKDKDQIINDFKNKFYNILVSTPIIEVGIDIPNANYIIINSADRFGLSQLHQLRGRVGRGDSQAYCFFFTSSENPKTVDRLKFISRTNNCFKISKFDLQSRGPGTIFSTLQHGFPKLKLANLSNFEQNKLARNIASELLEKYPQKATIILNQVSFVSSIQN